VTINAVGLEEEEKTTPAERLGLFSFLEQGHVRDLFSAFFTKYDGK